MCSTANGRYVYLHINFSIIIKIRMNRPKYEKYVVYAQYTHICMKNSCTAHIASERGGSPLLTQFLGLGLGLIIEIIINAAHDWWSQSTHRRIFCILFYFHLFFCSLCVPLIFSVEKISCLQSVRQIVEDVGHSTAR